jgi:7-carboxy-7-deazaguanine synthase
MSSTELQLNDLFWTLQGEGHWSGRRALFVRLPFCNYNCPWCDTEYNSYNKWSDEDFRELATKEPARFAVITGGEPMAHKHLPRILEILKEEGFYIACETNGSLPVPVEIDFVTTSPKAYTQDKHEPYYVHPETWGRTSEWKYVVEEGFDFDLLKRHEKDDENVKHSLSPEFNQMQANVASIMNYIKEHPQWQLSLQTHKWINIP